MNSITKSIYTGTILLLSLVCFGQVTFTQVDLGIPLQAFSSNVWVDYDNDGDLDLFISGDLTGGSYASIIYKNTGGVFTNFNAGFTGVFKGSADWGDYDNDGDLDLAYTGNTGTAAVSKIYNNNAGVFTDINAGLTGVFQSSIKWGDYDCDGDLDLILTGSTNTTLVSKIYRNDGGSFTDINAGLTGIDAGSSAWGDYDNDGDLDVVIAGHTGAAPRSKIYKNNNGTFTDIAAGLTGVHSGSVDWGDYDSDGDLDLLLIGNTGLTNISKIYRNDSGAFTSINAGLPAGSNLSSWGDYDNDGDLDVLIGAIYRNDSGSFVNTGIGTYGNAVWVDYDNDGDLDFYNINTRILYRNDSTVPDTVPAAPADLALVQDQNGIRFSFDPASDAETPSAGLTYNIEIKIGIRKVKSASSDPITGYRRVHSMGNIQQNTSWNYKGDFPDYAIPNGLYRVKWKVQSIDNCYAGSLFNSAVDTVMNRDLITVPKETMTATDALTWEYYTPADSIASYTLQLSGDSLFADYYEKPFVISKDVKTSYFGVDLLSLDFIDSLENNGKYFWRVKPEHVRPEVITGFKRVPDSFIYNPVYSAPTPVSISVEGSYVTLTWGTGKEAEKGLIYNVYSSDDPHAAFPAGWTLMISDLNATEWTVRSTAAMKFYCVTAAGSVK